MSDNDPRMGEKRGRNKWIVVALALVAIVAIIVITLLVTGGSSSEEGVEIVDETDAVSIQTPEPMPTLVPEPTPTPKPTPTPEPTPKPLPTATPIPTPTPVPVVMPEPTPMPRVIPKAGSGEGFDMLDEGEVGLEYPDGSVVDTLFTIWVNTTEVGGAGLFFVAYDESNNLINTVKIERYIKGSRPDNAEITLYYLDAPKRVIQVTGKIAVDQEYKVRPYGPSMFSLATRLHLKILDLDLSDKDGLITEKKDIDVTGFSGKEDLDYELLTPNQARRMLSDINSLVKQIEESRNK